MVVALLVVIILILLFGAAAVKGWIKSAIAGVAGFAIICAAIIWLGSFFGEDGFLYVVSAIAGLMITLGAVGLGLEQHEKRKAARIESEAERKRARKEERRRRRQLFRERGH